MKRRISDLLDGYLDDAVPLDTATPLSSRRIRERTMGRLQQQTAPAKRGIRVISKILIAAAVISMLTLTAAAATGSENWLRLFLRGKEQGEMTDSQVQYIAENTKNAASERVAVDRSTTATENTQAAALGRATVDGYTVTIDATLADAKDAYILLTLTAPEGVKLDADDYYFDIGSQLMRDGGRLSFLDDSGKRTDAAAGDNQVSMFGAFRLADFHQASFTDGKPFTLALRELHSVYGTGENAKDILVSPGVWEIEMTFQADAASREIPVEPFAVSLMPDAEVPEGNETEGTEVSVTAIEVSALSVSLQFHTKGDPTYGTQFPESYVVLRGGTRIALTQRVTDLAGGIAGFSTNAPIVLEEVDYVLIGSEKIMAAS